MAGVTRQAIYNWAEAGKVRSQGKPRQVYAPDVLAMSQPALSDESAHAAPQGADRVRSATETANIPADSAQNVDVGMMDLDQKTPLKHEVMRLRNAVTILRQSLEQETQETNRLRARYEEEIAELERMLCDHVESTRVRATRQMQSMLADHG